MKLREYFGSVTRWYRKKKPSGKDCIDLNTYQDGVILDLLNATRERFRSNNVSFLDVTVTPTVTGFKCAATGWVSNAEAAGLRTSMLFAWYGSRARMWIYPERFEWVTGDTITNSKFYWVGITKG